MRHARDIACCIMAWLKSLQKYFTYVVSTMCGIPTITLHGTPDDWKLLKTVAHTICVDWMNQEKWWSMGIEPFLDQCLAASKGNYDKTWWSSIYKYEGSKGSGGPEITGHINALFPWYHDGYDCTVQWVGMKSSRDPASLGSGLVTAPFVWKYLGTDIPMDFTAGFWGAKYVSANDGKVTIAPASGMVVTRKK